MTPKLRALIVMLAAPYPPAGVTPGDFISPEDPAVAASGFDMTEDLFAANPQLKKQGAALAVFFGDERGHLALKKAMHVIMEQRRRILGFRRRPPVRHGFSDRIAVPGGVHPLDEMLSGAAVAAAGLKGRLRLGIAVLARALHLVWLSALIGRRFADPGLTPRRGAVGAPGQVFTSDWAAFRAAAADAGVWREGGVTLIAENGGTIPGAPEWAPCLKIPSLPVEPSAWRAQVSRPARKFAWETVKLAAAGFKDVWALQGAYESLVIARDSLPWRRVAANVRFDWVVNVEEYSPKHIVKAMVFNAGGTRLARWPHSVMDMTGSAVSYLCYDLYLSSGPYPERAYGRTWGDVRETAAVGLFRNDRRIDRSAPPDAVWDNAVQTRLAAGLRMLVYFLPNAVDGYERVVEDTLRAVISVFAGRPDWFLVIKPKGRESSEILDEILRRDDNIRESLENISAVIVRIESPEHDPCPTGRLLDRMNAGVGVGSIQIEGLVQGAPVLCYWPIPRTTALYEKLRDLGLIFTDPGVFTGGLARVLDGGADISQGWFQEAFDPFSDGDTLGRLARKLLGGASGAAVNAPR
ncbi:MAG: hypothetical protein ACYYKD_01750 [Rhodospirillales bacterium]